MLPQSHHLAVLFKKENKDEAVMETSVTPGIAPLTPYSCILKKHRHKLMLLLNQANCDFLMHENRTFTGCTSIFL